MAPNSTFLHDVIVGKQNVTGTFDIAAVLCFPPSVAAGKGEVQGVQLLVHGGGFDRRYCDFAPGYSYIDTAVANNWAVLNFDRLGWGESSTPDPLNIVQFPMGVEIVHQLTLALRSGNLADKVFDTVVGVGHSFGSITSKALTVEYPFDWNATVLTGFAAEGASGVAGQSTFLATLNGGIANQVAPYRLAHLPDGYLIPSSVHGVEYAFFYPYNYDPYLVQRSYDIAGGFTWGEYLTLYTLLGANATEYSRPLAVVDGLQDLPNCLGNCAYPVDGAKAVRQVMYPMVEEVKSDSILIDGVGHGLNLHYQAQGAYEWIMRFLEKQGLGA